MDVAILFALILLNGAFAMSEIALVAARKAPPAAARRGGRRRRARRAAPARGADAVSFHHADRHHVDRHPERHRRRGRVLAPLAARWLHARSASSERSSNTRRRPWWSCVITYLTIVFGELVPKRLGQLYPETVARLVARPMELLALIARPFVALLVGFDRGSCCALLGLKDARRAAVTEEEIARPASRKGSDAGVIEAAGAPDGAQRVPPRRPPDRLDDGAARARSSGSTSSLPSPENVRAHRARASTRATRCAAAASTTCSASSARSACCSSALRGQPPQSESDAAAAGVRARDA